MKSGGIRQNPAKSGRIRQNPAESGRIRQNPAKSGKTRLNPEKFHSNMTDYSIGGANAKTPISFSLVSQNNLHQGGGGGGG